MSKQEPAHERVGITTPQSVAPCQQLGNTPPPTITAPRYEVECCLASLNRLHERTLALALSIRSMLGDDASSATVLVEWLEEIYADAILGELCNYLDVDLLSLEART